MKRFLSIIGVLTLFLIVWALYICATTGFFRSIENSYSGTVEKVSVPGAEDFSISRKDGFLIISSDDRAARRDGRSFTSGLYYMDLNSTDRKPEFLEGSNTIPLFPHGISMFQLDSNTYRLLVVNHVTSGSEAVSSMDPDTRHSIEEYTLRDKVLTHIQTFANELVRSPNDVVIVDETRFYFTNDHGSKTKLGLLAEDFLGFKRSDVVYYNGRDYQVVDDGIAYANGINLDYERRLLYVASPRSFLVKTYVVNEDGSLAFQTDIPCNSGVDNIELDENGKVWIGAHPKLLAFTSYSTGQNQFAPSELITIEYKNKSDYTVTSVYTSEGKDMSGSTTAIPYKGKVYVGNVMDSNFIILDQALLK